MTSRKHSLGLKLFIFFLVALMLFSAIGIMVLYLNTPTSTTGNEDTTTLPTTDTPTITVPEAVVPTTGAEDNAIQPTTGETDQKVASGTQEITGGDAQQKTSTGATDSPTTE